MIIVFLIFGFLIMILIIGKIIFSFQFGKEVKEFFSQSKNISDKKFSYKQLSGLPEPVQRYFKYVLKNDQSYISYVRLLHNGKFKTGLDNEWMTIKGEQYFTTEKPGYLWKGTTLLFAAKDLFLSDRGRLVVSLLSLIKIVDGKGSSFNEGELQRCIAEGVWFPTNLLPNEHIEWSSIDAHTAKLTFRYKEFAFFYLVIFNEIGEIIQMETKRYMDEEKRETWIGKLTSYKEINGIIIPTQIEAIWKLANSEYSYAKFNITKIEYDKPERF